MSYIYIIGVLASVKMNFFSSLFGVKTKHAELGVLQTDAPSEEKRQQHQKELAQKLNEEARERLKGMKSDTGDKK